MKVTVELDPSDFPEATKLLSLLHQIIPIYKQQRPVQQIIEELDFSNLDKSVEEISTIIEHPPVEGLAFQIVNSYDAYTNNEVFGSFLKRLPASAKDHMIRITTEKIASKDTSSQDLFAMLRLYALFVNADLVSANVLISTLVDIFSRDAGAALCLVEQLEEYISGNAFVLHQIKPLLVEHKKDRAETVDAIFNKLYKNELQGTKDLQEQSQGAIVAEQIPDKVQQVKQYYMNKQRHPHLKLDIESANRLIVNSLDGFLDGISLKTSPKATTALPQVEIPSRTRSTPLPSTIQMNPQVSSKPALPVIRQEVFNQIIQSNLSSTSTVPSNTTSSTSTQVPQTFSKVEDNIQGITRKSLSPPLQQLSSPAKPVNTTSSSTSPSTSSPLTTRVTSVSSPEPKLVSTNNLSSSSVIPSPIDTTTFGIPLYSSSPTSFSINKAIANEDPAPTIFTGLKFKGQWKGHTNSICSLYYDIPRSRIMSMSKHELISWDNGNVYEHALFPQQISMEGMDLNPYASTAIAGATMNDSFSGTRKTFFVRCGVVNNKWTLLDVVEKHSAKQFKSISALYTHDAGNNYFVSCEIERDTDQGVICLYNGYLGSFSDPVQKWILEDSIPCKTCRSPENENTFFLSDSNGGVSTWDTRMKSAANYFGEENSKGKLQAHSGGITCLKVYGDFIFTTGTDNFLCSFDSRNPGLPVAKCTTFSTPVQFEIEVTSSYGVLATRNYLFALDFAASGTIVRLAELHKNLYTSLLFHPTENSLLCAGDMKGRLDVYEYDFSNIFTGN